LGEAALARAEQFTWERCAQLHVDTYRRPRSWDELPAVRCQTPRRISWP
jgi:hypothetical protein